ncbi:MAG: hypothetical protein IPP74_11490 [Alphaproteobacteria bacterium]|nr:hypothetical protein [Alphaproteobacteria bacterium]
MSKMISQDLTDLSNNPLDVKFQHLCDSLDSSVSVNLDNTSLGMRGYEYTHLSTKLPANTSLRNLSLAGNGIQSGFVKLKLAPDLMNNHTLKSLNLANNQIYADGFSALVKTNLCEIDVRGNLIGNNSPRVKMPNAAFNGLIEDLTKNQYIQTLWFDEAPLGEQRSHAIRRAVHKPHVKLYELLDEESPDRQKIITTLTQYGALLDEAKDFSYRGNTGSGSDSLLMMINSDPEYKAALKEARQIGRLEKAEMALS